MNRSRIAARTGVARVPVAVAIPLAPASSLGHLAPPPAAGPLGAERVPVPDGPPLAQPGAPGPGEEVDGISSAPSEQFILHIHAHLTVFVDGEVRQIPYGIGIAAPREVQLTQRGPFVAGGARFSWLHTHAADGIVHIESPVRRTFHARGAVRRLGPAARAEEGRSGLGARHRVGRRQALPRQPARHPAGRARADPARRRAAAGRCLVDRVSARPLTSFD